VFRLSKQQIGFLESGVSVSAASHDIQNRPVQGRCEGCRVSADGTRITLFLSRVKYPFLLDAVRRSGTVAVSFTEPSTNVSIQIKGGEAELAELEPGDDKRIAAYFDLFTAELKRINIPPVLAHAVHDTGPGEMTAIAFTPVIAFSQTPGAKAGSPLAP
jgi:hypothetical protein